MMKALKNMILLLGVKTAIVAVAVAGALAVLAYGGIACSDDYIIIGGQGGGDEIGAAGGVGSFNMSTPFGFGGSQSGVQGANNTFSFTVQPGFPATFGTISLTGGAGGSGTIAVDAADGKGGGIGQPIIVGLTADIEAVTLILTGKNGGYGNDGGNYTAGGQGGEGADGGYVNLSDYGTYHGISLSGSVTMLAGNGGDHGEGYNSSLGNAGDGGEGGYIGVLLSSLTAAGAVSMTTGIDGTADPTGGAAASNGAGGTVLVLMRAVAGSTGHLAGHDGIFSSGAGLSLTVNDGTGDVRALGGDGYAGGKGGSGIISGSTLSVSITTNSSGSVSFTAYGGTGGTGGTGIAGGDASITATGGLLSVQSAGSGAGLILFTARGGDAYTGAGNGGAGIISGVGISVGVASDAAGTGPITLTAQGGDGGTGDTITGGMGKINASTGPLTVESKGAAPILMTAQGGNVTDGGGGAAEIIGTGITVSSDGAGGTGAVSVTARAGAAFGTDRNGGTASINSNGGDIRVRVGGNSNGGASLTANGTVGTGDGNGGGASIIDGGDIFLSTAAGTGGATITVRGGGAVGTGQAGSATVDSGAIELASGTGAAATTLFEVHGGANSSTGTAGAASVKSAGVSVVSDTASATFDIEAGSATGTGQGAAASLDTRENSGSVLVRSKGAANAILNVTSTSDGTASASLAGQNATLITGNLHILADMAGEAQVNLTAGDGNGNAKGGDADVTVFGNLTMKGSSNANTGGNVGKATLSAREGASGSGTVGSKNLTVTGLIVLESGSGAASAGGGDVEAIFDVVEAGQIEIGVGEDGTGANYSGSVIFGAQTSLATSKITLTNSDSGHGNLDFFVGELRVNGANDVSITTTGLDFGTVLNPTSAAAGTGAYFDTVTFDGNRRLAINNADGSLRVGLLDFSNASGRLMVADDQNLQVDYLLADNGIVTFELPAGFDDGDTFITVAGASADQGALFIAGDFFSIDPGDDVTFLNVTGTYTGRFETIQFSPCGEGLVFCYDFDFVQDGNGIGAVLRSRTAHPVMKSLSEGQMAAQAFLNRGSDLVAGEGITSAVFATANSGFSFFSSISYSDSRYETGSHVDVDGLSVILGGAYGMDVSFGRFTVGAFLELGDGDYDSFNDFSGFGRAKGTGDTKYVGGGVLARTDFGSSGTSYAEFSARFGRSSVDFRSDDLPSTHRYDIDSSYYGFHLGFGRIFNITGSTTFDLYCKWLFTRQGGNDVRVAGGLVQFDDVNSHRLRGGFKVTTEVNDWFKPYFGAAYEHEMDGKAEAKVGGARIDAPELKGGTGIGELGVSMIAVDSLTVDLGVQGYVGVRRGVSGGLRLTYNF
jgi:hypothetical protein